MPPEEAPVRPRYRFRPATWGDLSAGTLEVFVAGTAPSGTGRWVTVPDPDGGPTSAGHQLPGAGHHPAPEAGRQPDPVPVRRLQRAVRAGAGLGGRGGGDRLPEAAGEGQAAGADRGRPQKRTTVHPDLP